MVKHTIQELTISSVLSCNNNYKRITKLLSDRLKICSKVRWRKLFGSQDNNLSACSYWIIWIKWWITNKHFIHDCTKRPPACKININNEITEGQIKVMSFSFGRWKQETIKHVNILTSPYQSHSTPYPFFSRTSGAI